MYFSSPRSCPPTLKKNHKQVSVMINTYDDKKEPGKFGFIENESNKMNNNDDMSSRLKNELEKTLSRSNLKNRSESIVSF